MSEPTHSLPPDGRATPENSAGIRGKLFAVLCWLLFLPAVAVLAAALFIRFEHLAEADRRHALADEQRSTVATAAKLVHDIVAGPIPAGSGVSALRTRSLEILARVPPEPATDLQAEWTRLTTALDVIRTEWTRVLEFQAELEELRGQGRSLQESSGKLANLLASGTSSSLGRASGEVLAIASRQFAGEIDRASLAATAGLDRARALLDICDRAHGFLVAEIAGQAAVPALNARLATVAAQLEGGRDRVDAVWRMAGALRPVSTELGNLEAGSAKVVELLADFEARTGRAPAFLGTPLDAWLFDSAVLAVAGLLGLVWRRQRLLKAETAGLDRAWAEAAESDWRARGLVHDLVRAIDALDRPPVKGRSMDNEDLEASVREATASLPRIVARRSQLAAALLSARDPLRKRLAAARDSVLAPFVADSGDLDTTPLVEIEATFREATLFAMAALVREIRAAATMVAEAEDTPTDISGRGAGGTEPIRSVAARGFELLERSLDRVLAGEEEEHAALIFLLDDLRVAGRKPLFSASLRFNPDLARPAETGPKGGASLKADAARMLPSFRKGLTEWTATGDGGSATAKLVRGSIAVLARAAEEQMAPSRGFWSAASAFCTALCEGAIPAGPAVRQIMDEVSREFGELAEGEGEPLPPEQLFRELLLYVVLAKSDHADLHEVRAAFDLDRHPLAVPERSGEAESAEGERGADVSGEIIQQLEGIRETLDRINGPSVGPSEPGRAP